MKKIILLSSLLLASQVYAENKLSVDLTIDNLKFQRPVKGVGKAGILVFKTANVNNNGIVLNLNNVNNFFDSQIFIRPTFLGFTTQFGNYGFTLEENSMFNAINLIELQNSKLILDDNQLNLAGENLAFINPDMNVKLNNFRLYCQSVATTLPGETAPPTDMMKNCASFLTLNGTYNLANDQAKLAYNGVDKLTGDKTELEATVKTIDIRKDSLSIKMPKLKSISNDSYIISASEVDLKCKKDPELLDLDIDKMTKDCLNQMKLAPLKANLIDNSVKTNFALDIKDITVKDKIIYLTMNNGTLSDPLSTTSIDNMLLNCKKGEDTDVLELTQVLRDCISYARVSIDEVKSTKPDDKKGSSIKKIAISSASSDLIVQADVKIIGFTSRVSIYGKVSLNEAKKQLILTVTDTRLPLGMTSVNLLMYFLKKNLISKDVTYQNNTITVSL